MGSLDEHSAQRDAARPVGSFELPGEVNTPFRLADFLIFGCILALGALAFFSYHRASDFLYDDVYYVDCARSLLERGFYGIADRPETTQPPGVSGILALLCLAGGCTPAVFLCAMAVFETAGFLVCYVLLRRLTSRGISAAICLLLMSSPLYFSLATQWVSICFPFLFTTLGALVAADRLAKAQKSTAQIAWGCVLSGLLAAALMVGSIALALLGSIVAWIAINYLRDRHVGNTQLRRFALVLLVGAVVQGLWMHRKPFDEWPAVPGFPGPYLQQLTLRDARNPDLGKAELRDIPARILGKAHEESSMLADIVFRRWIDDSWASVVILGPMLLIVLGWFRSTSETGGGFEEWYFAACGFILLLWPWRLDPRSFLPIAPLVCLYLWRGVMGLGFLAKNKARWLGAVWLPAATGVIYASWFWMHGARDAVSLTHGGVQREGSFVVWTLSGFFAVWLLWKGPAWSNGAVWLSKAVTRTIGAMRMRPTRIAQLAGGAVLAGLIMIGVREELEMRRSNLDLSYEAKHLPPDVEAALWLVAHTDPSAVVMARQVPTTYHYAKREMVWFPPTANPKTLMEGIRKYKVNYVVLIHRKESYFLPPEEDCFANVLAENEGAFRLAADTAEYRIYETVKAASR